jgi:hypothetical protein
MASARLGCGLARRCAPAALTGQIALGRAGAGAAYTDEVPQLVRGAREERSGVQQRA